MDDTDSYKYYRFDCSFEGTGEITTDQDDPLLATLTTLPRRCLLYYPYNHLSPVFAPDCIIRCPDGTELFTVRQQRRFPLPRFVLTRGSQLVGTISQRSILLNSYSVHFLHGEGWVFHMPLFNIFFHGVSETGRIIEVREWEKRVWYVRDKAGQLNRDIICALAVIQRERLRVA